MQMIATLSVKGTVDLSIYGITIVFWDDYTISILDI
jgi:hypothetical protein